MDKKRKLQIGVMGSTADLKYTEDIEKIAEKTGELIAKSGNIAVYGAERRIMILFLLLRLVGPRKQVA